jgi:hypothetical protein
MERRCLLYRSPHRRQVLLHGRKREQPYERSIRLPRRLMRWCLGRYPLPRHQAPRSF